MSPAMRTAITREYTAMIPDMTTGISDWIIVLSAWYVKLWGWKQLAFIIRSGRNVPTPAMPMPDLAVPYAAPIPNHIRLDSGELWEAIRRGHTSEDHCCSYSGLVELLAEYLEDCVKNWPFQRMAHTSGQALYPTWWWKASCRWLSLLGTSMIAQEGPSNVEKEMDYLI